MVARDLIYHLKITLRVVAPETWRRLQVAGGTRLSRLHEILQVAMGWQGSRLHVFEIGNETFGAPQLRDHLSVADEAAVTLGGLVRREGTQFFYLYDFGSNWEHDILVEQIGLPVPGVEYPWCSGGARNHVPEGSGGPERFNKLVAILQDPQHWQHERRRAELGRGYDPAAFDLERVNEGLRALSARWAP